MAAFIAMGMQETKVAPAMAGQGTRPRLRRRISPQAGRALKILGHAIDYLTEEFVHDQGTFDERDAQLQAVRLLMAKNREIYLACPEVLPLSERCLLLLHLREA